MDDHPLRLRPTADRPSSARGRQVWLIAVTLALAILTAACSGNNTNTTTAAESDNSDGEETGQDAEDPMAMVADATEMTVNEVTGMCEAEIAFGGIPGREDIMVAGEGRYDVEAPPGR